MDRYEFPTDPAIVISATGARALDTAFAKKWDNHASRILSYIFCFRVPFTTANVVCTLVTLVCRNVFTFTHCNFLQSFKQQHKLKYNKIHHYCRYTNNIQHNLKRHLFSPA